jgi:hypothetical protein
MEKVTLEKDDLGVMIESQPCFRNIHSSSVIDHKGRCIMSQIPLSTMSGCQNHGFSVLISHIKNIQRCQNEISSLQFLIDEWISFHFINTLESPPSLIQAIFKRRNSIIEKIFSQA